MPAKKVMPPVEEKKVCSEGAMKWVWGIVTILLGVALWMSYLTIEQFFAIVFILVGIMKFCGLHSCGH